MSNIRRAACILFTVMMLLTCASCSLQSGSGDVEQGGRDIEQSSEDIDKDGANVPETSELTDRAFGAAGFQTDVIGEATIDMPDIYPVKDSYLGDPKWGYIDHDGMFVIQPSFSQAYRFQQNGLAVAGRNNGVGIIDRTGSFITEPVYTQISEFCEGLAVATDGKSYVVLDQGGRVISEKYQYIKNYSSGRAVFSVKMQDGSLMYGYLDENGKPVIQPIYKYANDFEGDRAVVKLVDGVHLIIDRSGNIIKTLDYWYVSAISDSRASFIENPGGKYGYIDSSGNEVIRQSFMYAGDFKDSRAVAAVMGGAGNEVRGLIDLSGKFIIAPQYNEILMLGEDRVALGISRDPNNTFAGSKYALADVDGELLTDFIFTDINHFSDGIASATSETSTFFINCIGKKIEELPSVNGVGYMERLDGFISATIDQRTFYMNEQGHVVYKPLVCTDTEKGIRVCEEKYRPNINYLVYYPVLGNMTDLKVEERVNTKLREMWTDISVVSIKPTDILDYNYEGKFSIVYGQKDLLVLMESGYNYPFGAAHGMPVMEHVHVNTRTGEFYQLKDLFQSGSDYAGILTEIVWNQINEMSESEDMLYWMDSYGGISDDHQFYISDHGINLYFQPYEIAPYAAGFPTFNVTFDEIDDIIDKKGDFWKSFN